MNPENQIKLFNQKEIRTLWDEPLEKWWFSVVDVVAVLSNSVDARNYWKVLKSRLNNEGSELVTKCNQLKMIATEELKLFTSLCPKASFSDIFIFKF